MTDPTPEWAHQFRAAVHTFIEHYHRHEIEADAPLPDEPCLIIGNHGFGGVFDLNVISMSRTLASLTDRPLLYLVHQIAWTLGTGRLVEALGCKPACATNAADGFAASQHVVVFPGGDLDAAKPWTKRNQIQFGGRAGHARLAIEHGVPIVPVVTAGAGESLFVLSDGQGLAARLGLHKYRRIVVTGTSRYSASSSILSSGSRPLRVLLVSMTVRCAPSPGRPRGAP